MKFLKSFRFKIFISLWVFGLFLVVIYHLAGISIALLTKHNDEKGSFELEKEVTHLLQNYKEHNQLSYPNSRFYKTYFGTANLPQNLVEKIRDLGIGYHSIDIEVSAGQDRSYYIAVLEQPGGSDQIYILYDYTRYANEYIDYQLLKLPRRFSAALVIAGVFGVFIGLFASKKLIAPLRNLASEVKDLDPEHLPTHISQNYKNDEVGILAKALETSMLRIKAFVEREKNFTRDASHELRTPVTVIKGAVELIRQLPEHRNTSLAKPIQRIERSIKNMEQIIEAFLWLAREQQGTTSKASCLVGDIIHNAIEENRHLIAAKPVSLDVTMGDNPRISVPENVFRIAVVNLIRNAFLYTSQGQITIKVQSKYIKITNTGITIPPGQLSTIKEPFQKGKNSKGSGLGLAIVERLCKTFIFKLDIGSDTESNTIVRLSLTP